MTPQSVIIHFQHVDRVLYNALQKLDKSVTLTPSTDYFSALCGSIINQQISTKAGDAIWARFCTLFPDGAVTPEVALTLQPTELRAIGLSNAKAKYILDLASKTINREIDLDSIPVLHDDEIMTMLTKVKGIGTWTVEMFLMFTLGREDIFSVKDLGLKRGIQKLYNLSHDPTPEELIQISSIWSPYRTYASMILWRSL